MVLYLLTPAAGRLEGLPTRGRNLLLVCLKARLNLALPVVFARAIFRNVVLAGDGDGTRLGGG
jgi:hypothetical protein